ncbi:MAG TPA: hypothetical protein VJ810_31635 [Blastocatellia bacterium]|nr:hypothetical protein [Blastocatellia bacterium]
MNAYWRAANYLSVGQIYLYANPLLREPLKDDPRPQFFCCERPVELQASGQSGRRLSQEQLYVWRET